MSIHDGFHRLRSKPNVPQMRNCFFCLKDKICKVVHLPPGTAEVMKKTAKDDPVMLRIIEQAERSQFACCDDCKKDRHKQAEAIAGHFMAIYHAKKK